MATEAKPAASLSPGTETPKKVHLDHFCVGLSNRVKGKVEMIGGFHHQERTAGRAIDTQAAYQERYESFTQKPVK